MACPDCSALLKRAEAAEKAADENYVDLLAQMDEAWGPAREIGREEITAMVSSRIVHKPTKRVREERDEAGQALAEHREKWGHAPGCDCHPVGSCCCCNHPGIGVGHDPHPPELGKIIGDWFRDPRCAPSPEGKAGE